MHDKHRVVITGMGLVTPLGITTESTWKNLIAGKSGLSRAEHPALLDYAYNAVGIVSGEQDTLDKILDTKNQSRTDRFIHLAMLAGHEALAEAQPLSFYSPEEMGVCLGIGIGGLKSINDATQTLLEKGHRSLSPFTIPKSINNMAANLLSIHFNLQGPSYSVTSACSSGGDAIGQSFRMIRDGYAQAMLTGGAESCLTPLAIYSFGNMRALSGWKGDARQASRPFDKDRTGFVIAEGAGIMVLERMDLAQKRGAHCYAEVVGYGDTCDAYHVTAMHPEGFGATRAIQKALFDGKINSDEVAYVNAHGTGTPMNDAVETTVLKKVFNHQINPATPGHILVGSTKSMTGHMIGAAGGVEVGITALALKHGIVPPTINLDNPDPTCDLNYISKEAQTINKPYALSNSFGFGGGNAVIALKKM